MTSDLVSETGHPRLENTKLAIVGGASGIAIEIASQAVAAGAAVTLAGRHVEKVRAAAQKVGPPVESTSVDLGDERSIRTLADEAGEVDYVVTLASNPANGPVTDVDRGAVLAAFDAKVIGPLLVAKHLAPRMRAGGALLLFSGVVAWKPAPGLAVMATTNGAVSFLAQALAVDLAPLRVNALSPGIVDSGAWDDLGPDKDALFHDTAVANPARRIGQPADIASAALLALTNPFITGTTLHVDGGGRLS